jgi:hypothetical protein
MSVTSCAVCTLPTRPVTWTDDPLQYSNAKKIAAGCFKYFIVNTDSRICLSNSYNNQRKVHQVTSLYTLIIPSIISKEYEVMEVNCKNSHLSRVVLVAIAIHLCTFAHADSSFVRSARKNLWSPSNIHSRTQPCFAI